MSGRPPTSSWTASSGIGGRAGLPDPIAALAGACTQWLVPLVAVDLPSGVDADTGAVPGAAFTRDADGDVRRGKAVSRDRAIAQPVW